MTVGRGRGGIEAKEQEYWNLAELTPLFDVAPYRGTLYVDVCSDNALELFVVCDVQVRRRKQTNEVPLYFG